MSMPFDGFGSHHLPPLADLLLFPAGLILVRIFIFWRLAFDFLANAVRAL